MENTSSAVPSLLPVMLGLLLAGPTSAADSYPLDVAEYIKRRDLCEHFRQEPWPEGRLMEDKERRQFIAGQFERYCKDSDATLRKLKRKYTGNQAVLDRLEKYEADIEGQP